MPKVRGFTLLMGNKGEFSGEYFPVKDFAQKDIY
jgi:hypothetical protein